MIKKFIHPFLLLVTMVTLAQSKQELELRDTFWNTTIKEAHVNEVPEKWNSESAVILYKNAFYGFTNNGKRMYNPSYIHYRTKLQDLAALEAYATFSFKADDKSSVLWSTFSKETTTVGIKVIKPDGTENIVDVDAEAVSQDQEKRIAIPSLEIGDILDIFIYEDSFQKSWSGTYVYPAVERVISQRQPQVYSRIAIEVENDYFLNMQSYNGAPDIKEEETDKRSTRRYVLETRDVEKSDFPRWSYPLVDLPSLKFQVTFALKSRNEESVGVFLAEKDAERKSEVTKEEILAYYEGRFAAYKKSIRDAVRYVEEKGITDKREKMVEAFYYARHFYFNKFIELAIASQEGISQYNPPCDGDLFSLDPEDITNYMAGLAREFEIDYDVVVATADYNGSIDDLLIRSNVSKGIRLNFEEPLYIFNLSPHAQLNQFPFNLEGTKVYTISVKKARRLDEVTTDFLPISEADDNLSYEKLSVEINDSFDGFSIDRNIEYSGQFKIEELSRWVFFGDFLKEEFEKYGTKNFYNCKSRQKNFQKEIEAKMNAVMLTARKSREEYLATVVGNTYELAVKDYEYKPVKTARYSSDPLIIEDNFTMGDDFINKAGKNYIINVGKFIGGQVQIGKDEIARTTEAHIDYAKTFKYEVAIKIPEGYSVVGIEKLQRDVTNETGSFKSNAGIEDGILTFTTSKKYAKRNFSPSDWPKMLSWLEEAYDFSQAKILFKKD